MGLSDEIKSLSATVKKLTAAVEGYALRLACEGKVDLNTLPLFNSPYCSFNLAHKRDNNLPNIPTGNNEAKDSPSASITQNTDAKLGAHQVFDKLPAPDFLLEVANIQAPNSYHVLVEMSEPTSTSTEKSVCASEVLMSINEDDNAQGNEKCEMQVTDQCSQQKFGLIDEVNENLSCIAQPISINEIQLLNAHNVLDEMPQIVDVARKGLEVMVRQNDHLLNIHKEFDGSPLEMESTASFKHLSVRILVKFQPYVSSPKGENEDDLSWVMKELEGFRWNLDGSIDCHGFIFDPGVHVLLTNRAQIDYFTKFFESKNGWKITLNYKEVHSWGKLVLPMIFWNQLSNIIELFSFQIVVTYRWVMDKIIHGSVITTKHDIDDHVHVTEFHFEGFIFCGFEITHLLPVLVRLCFDPGDKMLKPMLLYNPTLEDKGDFRGAEGKIYVKHMWNLFIVVFWSNYVSTWAKASAMYRIHIFDPGDLHWLRDFGDGYLCISELPIVLHSTLIVCTTRSHIWSSYNKSCTPLYSSEVATLTALVSLWGAYIVNSRDVLKIKGASLSTTSNFLLEDVSLESQDKQLKEKEYKSYRICISRSFPAQLWHQDMACVLHMVQLRTVSSGLWRASAIPSRHRTTPKPAPRHIVPILAHHLAAHLLAACMPVLLPATIVPLLKQLRYLEPSRVLFCASSRMKRASVHGSEPSSTFVFDPGGRLHF